MAKRGRLPGTRLNQKFRPGAGLSRDYPRYAAVVAKGLDVKLFRGAEVTRGQKEDITLTFDQTTYLATLPSEAVPDRARSRLRQGDGRVVSPTRWSFAESTPGSGVFDQVSIDPTFFSSLGNYRFDYVSADPADTDEVPVDDLREIISMGDAPGQTKYREGQDYLFVTTAADPDPGVDNNNPTASVVTAITNAATNTGTGTVSHNSSTYSHKYNRSYVVRVLGPSTVPTAAAPSGTTGTRLATLYIEAIPTSGGADSLPPRLAATSNGITVSLTESSPSSLTNIAAELGITLDFAFGATNFVAGDQYTFAGNGPGVLEISDAMRNTNQFAETSAVVIGTATGEGTIAVNPQSSYTGKDNQSIQIQCTAASGSGTSRQATFRVTGKAALKQLTGLLSTTNGSTALTGSGTQFLAELQAGDVLFVGADPIPVTIASITNNELAVLSAVVTQPSQTSARSLRVRPTTGLITVLVTAASRVSLLSGSGLFADFSFGANASDNFDVGDTFTFTAKAKAVPYNGKENREYKFTVTSTTPLHGAVVTYSADVVVGTFGSHTFAEGNPLNLPNNVQIHARNLSFANRLDAVSPVDTFTMPLTFDGIIDWSLTKAKVETISTADLRRDVTGGRTGTVGAYYVEVREVPTSVQFVRGPAPTLASIAFNHAPGSQIIWFATNPGVNLTVAYRYKGAEPEPGNTYYMTGYQRRPDSDYNSGQLFRSYDEALAFLAPMTPTNDAAIAAQIAWEQNETTLPGLVVFLVKDSDSDGIVTTADYDEAIRVSQRFLGTMDAVVVNQFAVRDTFTNSVINMNDPTVGRHRIGYHGFPSNYPLGDEFTPGSRVFSARTEFQVFVDTPARGTIAGIGNASAKKTILVDSLGDGNIDQIPTQVVLDGSFLAVALAASVASSPEPWQMVLNRAVVGFDEIEFLNEDQMILLQDAGLICIKVSAEGSGEGTYIGTSTTDETEPSTEQLSGTVQRQYVFSRLKAKIDSSTIGYVADSPEDAEDQMTADGITELGSMVSEGKIGKYIDKSSGQIRPISSTDFIATRHPDDPVRVYFQCSYYNKYGILYADGTVVVDGPVSG